MPKLQLLLLIAVGGCLIVNALVSLSHAYGPDSGHNLAIHEAMADFKKGTLTNTAISLKSPEAEASVSARSSSTVKDGAPVASKIASLSCEKYGGPPDQYASEMVYWSDIPSDSQYVSPLQKKHGERRQYMTFEPDGGGWNNIRMAMETVVGLAIATGRTLVLPPQKRMYLLAKGHGKQKTHFDFDDFFPLKQMALENAALDMITMQEFLESEATTGRLKDKDTGKVSFPPNNRTAWDGMSGDEYDELRDWLRTVALVPEWRPGQCMATFPSQGDHKSVEELKGMQEDILKEGHSTDKYKGNPVAVDSATLERMKENLAGREDLCIYNESMQKQPVIHFACAHKLKLRLLVHFYAFLFMEDWREDLWMKRFMRDHMRYKDEIQCAAGRVVHAMRQIARDYDPNGNPDGIFDTFHIRRGDFQFKNTRIEADLIYRHSREELTHNSTIFVATDEMDKKFFDPLKKHYNIRFLDDFKEELKEVNSNYFGMIDQLVASRGRVFFGCWFSTFTGFINRIRGYRAAKDKLPGYESGALPTSFYYATIAHKFEMSEYVPMRTGFFNREFPTSWRDLDKGIKELQKTMQV